MDGRRFDEWTRIVSGGTGRRGAVRLLAGGALVGSHLRVGAGSAAARTCIPHGEFCEGPPHSHECCGFQKWVCIHQECARCLDRGDKGCKNDDQCCDGLKCKRRECVKR